MSAQLNGYRHRVIPYMNTLVRSHRSPRGGFWTTIILALLLSAAFLWITRDASRTIVNLGYAGALLSVAMGIRVIVKERYTWHRRALGERDAH